MKITALLAAGALALCAAPTTEARLGRHGRSLRWGGWNGAAAQTAAVVIGGFSGATLNGPTSGGYNPGYSNYNAPIVRLAYDEDDDDLGGQSFSVSGGVSGQSGGTNYNANFGYKNEWDEDDDDLGGKKKNRRSPRFCVNCPARSGNGFTAGDGLTPPPWRL